MYQFPTLDAKRKGKGEGKDMNKVEKVVKMGIKRKSNERRRNMTPLRRLIIFIDPKTKKKKEKRKRERREEK